MLRGELFQTFTGQSVTLSCKQLKHAVITSALFQPH